MGAYDRGQYLPVVDEDDWEDLVDDNFRRLADLGFNPQSSVYNADPTGVRDSTAAFASVFGAVPTGSGTVPSLVMPGPGTFRITATIPVTARGLMMFGTGIGNATDYSTPGAGTTFFWDGPAGDPIFTFTDCRHIAFSNLFIEGNPGSLPSDVLFFDSTGNGHGSNELMYFKHCRFGVGFNSTRTSDGVVAATNLVRFGGPNQNNDQYHFEDCTFHGGETGFWTPNSQSVWGQLSDCFFNRCTTAAIRTSANLNVEMVQFNDNEVDVQVDSTAQVDVSGWYSEGTHLMAKVTGNSGMLRAKGGMVLVPAGYAGANLIEATSLGGLGGLRLEAMTINPAQNGFVMPKIYVRGNNSTDQGSLVVKDVPYLTLADFDVEADANPVTGGIVCKIDVEEHEVRQWLGPSDVLSTTKTPMVVSGPFVPRRSELATAATGGDLHVPTVAGASTGVPDTYDGVVPVRIDRVNHQFEIWIAGDWGTIDIDLRMLSPDAVPSVLAWYDLTDVTQLWQDTARTTQITADGQGIKGITDKTGNGHHLSEATNPPTYKVGVRNGKSAGLWDGVNDVLSDTSFPNTALPLSVFAVGAPNNTATNKDILDGTTANRVSFQVLGNGAAAAWAGGSLRSNFPKDAEAAWHVLYAVVEDAALGVILGQDGVEDVANTAGSSSLQGLRIGANNVPNADFFDGYLAHVFVVGAAVGSRDRTAACRWLGNELDVTVA